MMNRETAGGQDLRAGRLTDAAALPCLAKTAGGWVVVAA
jgi:hypothetical protein